MLGNQRGKNPSVDARRKMREAKLGKTKSDETRKRMTEANILKWKDPEYRSKIVEANKRNWSDNEFIHKMLLASHICPNKPELTLERCLNKWLPSEYTINVKATVMTLGRKIPDFVNVNGQKKLIDLWGDFWHRGQNPQERIDYFKQFGWSTLIVWEHELENLESLKDKVLAFNTIRRMPILHEEGTK